MKKQLTCRYRRDSEGEVERKIFDHPDLIPDGEGWVDTPAKLKAEEKPAAKKAPAKRRSKQPVEKADG
jgi:hypothetical protein